MMELEAMLKQMYGHAKWTFEDAYMYGILDAEKGKLVTWNIGFLKQPKIEYFDGLCIIEQCVAMERRWA